MKVIETLYDFAKQLDYQVNWTEQANTFTEHVQENNHGVDLLYQQDGDRLIISAPKISLSDVDDAEKAEINRKAMSMNINYSDPVFYGLIDDIIYARANVLINDNIDDVITQYIRTRQDILKAVTTSDLVAIAK